jgi:hypothetical protein
LAFAVAYTAGAPEGLSLREHWLFSYVLDHDLGLAPNPEPSALIPTSDSPPSRLAAPISV